MERQRWQHTSVIAASALNAQRGKKDKHVPYDAFVPKAEEPATKTQPKRRLSPDELKAKVLALAGPKGFTKIVRK